MKYEEVKKLPKYAKVGNSAVRLQAREETKNTFKVQYFRDCGLWWIGVKLVEGKPYSIAREHNAIHNKPIVPITKKEWYNSNRGSVNSSTKAYIKTTRDIDKEPFC